MKKSGWVDRWRGERIREIGDWGLDGKKWIFNRGGAKGAEGARSRDDGWFPGGVRVPGFAGILDA